MVTFQFLRIKKVRAMTTATSRFSRSDSDESAKSSRNMSGKSSAASSEKKRIHLMQLRNITAKLLREDSLLRTTSSLNGSPTRNDPKNTHRRKVKICEETKEQEIHDPSLLKAWVESKDEASRRWIEQEAAPIDIVAVNTSDSMTHQTALCSAFEMLSFENFCNAGLKFSQAPVIRTPAAAAVNTEPIKVVGHTPAHDDGFMVPREISFANHGICGCTSIPLSDEHHFMGRQRSSKNKTKSHKGAFMKRLLPFKPGKAEKPARAVMKVKVYVDRPKEHMGSDNSIGESTLTIPQELDRSGSNTTI